VADITAQPRISVNNNVLVSSSVRTGECVASRATWVVAGRDSWSWGTVGGDYTVGSAAGGRGQLRHRGLQDNKGKDDGRTDSHHHGLGLCVTACVVQHLSINHTLHRLSKFCLLPAGLLCLTRPGGAPDNLALHAS